jgi:hypothetical protein
LAHTNEFIGGNDGVTTMLKARSGIGRSFLEICKCAGWGDVGFFSRWTMEITNNSLTYTIPLKVNSRIAQVIFIETDKSPQGLYSRDGHYQATNNLVEVMATWNPTKNMLPALYRDREITNPSKKRKNEHDDEIDLNDECEKIHVNKKARKERQESTNDEVIHDLETLITVDDIS